MNNLTIFESPEFGSIRTLTVDGEPYFVGKDVAEVLGYSDTAKAIRVHVDEEDKQIFKVDEMATLKTSNYGIYIINESGLYSLVFASKLPTAKKFKHWVTSEVLPTIRKTGTYSTKKTQHNPELAKLRADAMMLNAKNRVAKQMMALWTAAGVEPQYQALAMNDFYEGLSVPRIAFKAEATALFDLTTIAKHLGVMSKSGKPHAQAIGAIIEKLKPLDDGEEAITPYSRNGHDGESTQYTLSVEQKVAKWLKENNYPNPIVGKDKNFTVKYVNVVA